MAGDPIAARAAAEEGRDLADAIGDRFDSRRCRWCLGNGADICRVIWPEPPHNSARWRPRPRQLTMRSGGRTASRARASCWRTRVSTGAARAAADAAVEAAAELGGVFAGIGYVALAAAALAAGDAASGAGRERGGLAAPECPARRRRRCTRLAVRRPRWRAGIWSRPAAGPTTPSSMATGWYLIAGADDARPRGDRAR